MPSAFSASARLSLFALLLAGCAGNPVREDSRDLNRKPPEWLLNPIADGYYSAVGVAGPTFFRRDALDEAQEDARRKLAVAVQTKVEVVTLDIYTSGAHRREKQQFTEVSETVTKLVLEKSEVHGTWYDKKGVYGDPGFTYAIARLSKSDAK